MGRSECLKSRRDHPKSLAIREIFEECNHGQDNRYRPGNHQLLRRNHGRQQAEGDRKCRGRSHDALDRRLHGRRGDPGRGAGKASGRHQPEEHPVCGQAADRAQVRGKRSAEGHRPDALRDRQGGQRRRMGRLQGQEARAAADLGRSAAQDEEDRGGLPGRGGDRSRDHRAGLLQRQPAPGDQGRGSHRRPGSQADHQRADGGSAGLRPGQGRQQGSQDRRLRPGWRHLRHLDHRPGRRGRREAVRSAVDQRRYVPGRRGFRPAHHRLHHHGVQEGSRRRSVQGRARAAAPEGVGREGEDRTVVEPADGDQPAVRHDGLGRARAPQHEDHPREARSAGGGTHRPDHRALPHRDQGRRRQGVGHRRRDHGRRHDPDAEGAGEGQGVLRQGSAP